MGWPGLLDPGEGQTFWVGEWHTNDTKGPVHDGSGVKTREKVTQVSAKESADWLSTGSRETSGQGPWVSVGEALPLCAS